MLRDETRLCHARRGVYLQEVYLVACRDDVVDADDAATTKQVVYHRGQLRDAFGKAFADAGWRYLVAFVVVLGCVVEELILRDHLCDGEHDALLLCLVAAARELCAIHEGLHHHVFAFLQSEVDGRTKLLDGLHLCRAEGGTASGGLHEARQTDARHDVLVAHLLVVTNLHEQAVGNGNAESTHVIVEHELVVGHGFDEDATGRVRHSNEVEVALQLAVLARSTMNRDVGKVGKDRLAFCLEAEVVSVDFASTAIRKQSLPFASMNLYLIYIITRGIDERSNAFRAAHTYIMFRAITATNYCYCLFHLRFDYLRFTIYLLFNYLSDAVFFLHLLSNASISSGSSLEKNISWPVVGCLKPSVFA